MGEAVRALPKVQIIDLDAAMASGDNIAIVRRIAPRLACRVGGGIRTIERAREILAAGARQIIAGSSLFKNGQPDLDFAKRLADAVGPEQVIAAVDSRGGHVVIHGWKTVLPLTATAAVRALDHYCGEFLYTHVDAEGSVKGTDIAILRFARPPPVGHGRRRHHDTGGNRHPPPIRWMPSSEWRCIQES